MFTAPAAAADYGTDSGSESGSDYADVDGMYGGLNDVSGAGAQGQAAEAFGGFAEADSAQPAGAPDAQGQAAESFGGFTEVDDAQPVGGAGVQGLAATFGGVAEADYGLIGSAGPQELGTRGGQSSAEETFEGRCSVPAPCPNLWALQSEFCRMCLTC